VTSTKVINEGRVLGIVAVLNLLWAPVNLMVSIGTVRWVSLSILMTLLLLTPWFRKITGYKSMSLRDWGWSFLLGLLLFGPAHILYYASIGLATEVEGTVLLTTSPLWTGMFSYFILHEKVSKTRAIAIGLSLVGAYIVAVGFTIPEFKGGTQGKLMFGAGVILECFMGVIAALISRRTSGVSVLCGQMWGGAVSFLLLAAIFPIALTIKVPTHAIGYLPVLYLILISGLITFTVWYRIVEDTPLTLLVIGIAIQPPVAALLNWMVKGNLPQVNTIVGAVIILLALAIGFGKEKSPSSNLEAPGPG
jgi:drug/metabolite transporter (DMT)-like permease